MKKVLFLLSIVLLGFSSCIEGPQGPAGRDGRDGRNGTDGRDGTNGRDGLDGLNGDFNRLIFDYEIRNSNWEHIWEYNPNMQCYSCRIEVPELTQTVYNDGIILSYVEVLDGNAWVQQSLPRVFSRQNENGDKWIETIDFDYSTGDIIFYFTTSDFFYEDFQPGTFYFRVIFLW